MSPVDPSPKGLNAGTIALLRNELSTRRLAELLVRPENRHFVEMIQAATKATPDGVISTPTAIRMVLLRWVGPLEVDPDRMELLVILLETALCSIDWSLMTELVSSQTNAESSPSPSSCDPSPTTNTGWS